MARPALLFRQTMHRIINYGFGADCLGQILSILLQCFSCPDSTSGGGL